MKNKIVLLALIGIGFVSCKKTETTVVEKTSESGVLQKVVKECYSFTNGKDTIEATITIEGEKVMGNLAYKFFEKDKSSGPFTGMVKGDTLFGEYSFQSEGSQSVREIAFLRKDNELKEGYADIEDKNGKVVFKDKKALQFTGNTVLKLTPCR